MLSRFCDTKINFPKGIMFIEIPHDRQKCLRNSHIKCVCKSTGEKTFVQDELDRMISVRVTIDINIVDSEDIGDFCKTFYLKHKVILVKSRTYERKNETVTFKTV